MNEMSQGIEPQDETQRAQAVKREYTGQLMTKANVVGVGVGFCQRHGQRTAQVGLVVMVNKKLPATQLAPEDVIPHEIDGVPVDVQEVGEIRAYG